MNINQVIFQPEGRRLEFKESLPEKSDIAKSVIAFSNDAGGDLYIGIKDNPRKITGIPEEELFSIEEQISNVIYSRCHPIIIPDITFLSIEGKHIIRISVYKGNTPPYHLKEKGAMSGTYIRIGSSNRLAEDYIVAELERKKRNVTFDSEITTEKTISQINIDNFKSVYKEKTGEDINEQILKKLELYSFNQGENYPTNALILFSDDELRNRYFHFAKIECARFKGTSSEFFIDKKTIDNNISLQAEEAYNFVLRHINQGATVEGVYTIHRWEYPVKAIREIIRNAVVHRDYSLQGKDIKVAVYDDMVEITSPGLLPSSIDFSQMETGQSDARNRIIAPVFKKLGIIDQWGNGLKLVAEELLQYPEIELIWKEIGLSLQIQFVKKNFKEQPEQPESQQQEQQELQPELQQKNIKDTGLQQNTKNSTQPELQQQEQQEFKPELLQETLYSEILLNLKEKELSTKEISEILGQKEISGQLSRVIKRLLSDKLIERTITYSPNHPAQKHRITEQGRLFLKLLGK